MCETNIESFVGFYATNFFYMSAKSLTQFDTFMTQYESHLGPKTGRKLHKVTNIHDAKWQSSWAQDGMQVGLARTIEFGCPATRD